MEWTKIESSSYHFMDSGKTVGDLSRFNHGACSFGDEIFIFAGKRGSNKLSNAYAWNPETGVVREIYFPESTYLSPCCAVPFGSKIYVIGMNSASVLKIFEYTP